MSGVLSWQAAIIQSNLERTQKYIALYLALHMNHFGEIAQPSLETMVKQLGMSRRTVQTNLAALAEEGWLHIERQDVNGRSLTNSYHPTFPSEEWAKSTVIPPTPTNARESIATRLKETELPEDWRAYCMESFPLLDPEQTFLSFRDYWIAIPGQRGLKRDWFATWRNWCRREKPKPQPKPRSSVIPMSIVQREARPGETVEDVVSRLRLKH